MNFFEHQARAERNTGKLVFLFLCSVVGIVGALYLVAVLASGRGPWQPDLLLLVGGVALAIIALGSFFKVLALRGGGKAIAQRLGGRQVVPGTRDPLEKQLLNVVEEMSIASGLPMPAVFVMADESGINAFAAGSTPNDAAVAVTRGCLELLDRDQLQGVIAHEFSHILNGDMRLNVRLIGILSGILAIGIIGYAVMRAGAHTTRVRSSRESGGAAAGLMAIGAAVMVIGYVGLFFGRLIKAAVSRQREFLADASAVAMTRDPSGLAGALKAIGGYPTKGRLVARYAEEASHMYFEEGVAPPSLFANAMATHPSLEERIRRVDKSFSPKKEQARRTSAPPAQKHVHAQAEAVVGMVGAPTEAHIARGHEMSAAVPEAVRTATQDPLGAVTLCYALLLDEDAEMRRAQLDALTKSVAAPIVDETLRMFDRVRVLDPRLRLPVVDMAAPSLRNLGDERAAMFLGDVALLVEADRKMSVFEYALQAVVRHRVADPGPTRVLHRSAEALDEDVAALLSVLAGFGHDDPASAEHAYNAGMAVWARDRKAPARGRAGPQDMERALARLNRASPAIKATVVEACAHCVLADDDVTVEEAELLRAVCVTLDCPLPPFLDG